jgi:hypothetical protein
MLQRLADRLLPAHLAAAEHGHAFARAHILSTMSMLGIADQLSAHSQDTRTIAERTGCDPDAAHRLLRAACVFGAARMDKHGRVRRTRLSRSIRTDSRHRIGDWCTYLASEAHQAAWATLPESVRTGKPAFRQRHGMSLFDHFADNPAEGQTFSRGLGGLTLSEAAFVIGSYPFPRSGVVCDLAGGQGVLLAEILHAHPELQGMIVEAPDELTRAAEYLTAAGVAHRVELRHGDLLAGIDATADLYLLKWIRHDWDDDTCVSILKAVAATMPPAAKILIIEGNQKPNHPDARFAMIDLEMLVVTEGGRERSADEYNILINRAGLKTIGHRSTATGLHLIEAAPS